MGKISVVKQVLDANDRIANENRALFDSKGIFVINLMSSPGAGKTALLRHTLQRLADAPRHIPLDRPVRIRVARVARREIPSGGAFASWLDAEWVSLDQELVRSG